MDLSPAGATTRRPARGALPPCVRRGARCPGVHAGPRLDRRRLDLLRNDRPRSDHPRSDRPRSDRPRNDRPRNHRPRDERPRDERPRHDPRSGSAVPPR